MSKTKYQDDYINNRAGLTSDDMMEFRYIHDDLILNDRMPKIGN